MLAIFVRDKAAPFFWWTCPTWGCLLNRNRYCMRATYHCWAPGYCKEYHIQR